MIYYQFRADRARRALRGIDEQVARAAKAVAGLAPVKRNRFIALDGAAKSVNRELEAKARDLAGLKGYVTNLTAPAGPSGSSSAPPAGTAPCRSAPASTSSPPKTRYRPTSATPSPSSSSHNGVRTSLIKVRSYVWETRTDVDTA
jgi:hypothetical protein